LDFEELEGWFNGDLDSYHFAKYPPKMDVERSFPSKSNFPATLVARWWICSFWGPIFSIIFRYFHMGEEN